MKKAIVVVLVILFLMLLVVPGAVGLVAESEFRKLSANLGSEAPGFRLAVEEYERGWFTSRARYRLSFNHSAAASAMSDEWDELPSIVNEADIYHGPITFAALGRDGASIWPVLARSFDRVSIELGNGQTLSLPGEVNTRLAIAGKHSHDILVKRFEHQFDDPDDRGKFVWDGMKFNTRFDSSLSSVEVDAQIGAIDISSKMFHLRAGPVSLASQQDHSEFGIWTGDARVSWEGLSVEAPDARSFSMSGFASEVHSEIKAGMFEQGVEMTLADVSIAGWTGGPGRLELLLEKLDARAVGELARKMRDMAVSNDGSAEPAKIMPGIFPQLQALLAGGPHLALRELSFKTQDGTVMLSADLVFPESAPEAAFGFILGLEGLAEVRIPAALIGRLGLIDPGGGAQLQALMDAGLLVKKEGHIVLDAALKGGLLTVNGQPIPLPAGF